MANVKIGDLTDGVASLGTDEVEVKRNSGGPLSRRVPLGVVKHSELTISSGAITPTSAGIWIVDTEADASSDDLDTITALPTNTVIGLMIANDARDVILTHQVGNIFLPGATSFRLRDADEIIWLRYDGANWIQINFGGMGQVSQAQAEAGAVTAPFLWSPERVGQAIAKLGGAGKQTIPFLPGAMFPPETSGAQFGKLLAGSNTIPYWAFDTGADEHLYIPIVAPKSSDETAGVSFDYVWSHPSTATNFGVAFFMEILAVGNDDALNGAMGTPVELDDTGGTTDDLYRSAESSAVTPGGTWAEGDMLLIHIYRDVSDSFDDLAVDARLHQLNVHFTFNNGNDA